MSIFHIWSKFAWYEGRLVSCAPAGGAVSRALAIGWHRGSQQVTATLRTRSTRVLQHLVVVPFTPMAWYFEINLHVATATRTRRLFSFVSSCSALTATQGTSRTQFSRAGQRMRTHVSFKVPEKTSRQKTPRVQHLKNHPLIS